MAYVIGFEENVPDIMRVRILVNAVDMLVKFSDISIADFELTENPTLQEILEK